MNISTRMCPTTFSIFPWIFIPGIIAGMYTTIPHLFVLAGLVLGVITSWCENRNDV